MSNTIIQAGSLNKTVYQGTHGNLSMTFSENTLTAVAAGTQIQILDLPAGLRIPSVSIVSTSGLGDTVTMDIMMGDSIILSDLDMSVPISHTRGLPPTPLTEQTIMSVVINGGPATGDLTITPIYSSEGSL